MHKVFVIIYILLLVSHTFGAQEYPDMEKDEPACIGDQRTVLSIIWSCLATIFACTWLAVHPNVPSHRITSKGTISCAIERAKVLTVTILAPEVIVAWAAEQFIVSWKLCHGECFISSAILFTYHTAGKYDSIASVMDPATGQKENSKLTLAHGFLLSMGGFYYTHTYTIDQKPAPTPLPSILPWSVSDYLLDHDGFRDPKFPPHHTPSLETIHIPGKLVTLKALESEPGLVTNLAAISPETIEDRSKGDTLSKTIAMLQLSWFIVQCIARALQHLPITLLEISAVAFAGLSVITYSLWWYKPLNVKYQISLDGGEGPETSDPADSVPSISSSLAGWAHRKCLSTMDVILRAPFGIPSREICDFRFYSGTSEEALKRFWTMVCVGSLFWATHCMAESFSFPSHAKMVLWRFSSIAVLIGLVVGNNIRFVLDLAGFVKRAWLQKLIKVFFVPWESKKLWVKILSLISIILTFVGIVLYMIARIILIILAFLQLRSLPHAAFCTVQWTTYIPHI
ncbi:hypothetical protein EDD18DRAFT_1470242 [Armillaria luteobubalina]|uniref:Uncharacterized protein n=1 Tax=Armillaria luteobubalina TaxID=153913 RepID=A0AA39UEG2_9AGAR|nr:hypothetical protein EDD18DRAFT_1470242 [Armillaria luteobubalina]